MVAPPGMPPGRPGRQAWSYGGPLPAAGKPAGRVALAGDGIEVELSEPAA